MKKMYELSVNTELRFKRNVKFSFVKMAVVIIFSCLTHFSMAQTIGANETAVQKMVKKQSAGFSKITTSSPFSKTTNKSNKADKAINGKKQFFTLDLSYNKETLKSKEELVKMTIPMSDNVPLTLLLKKVNIFAESFILTAASSGDKPIESDLGSFYWGVVEGYEKSTVAINIFKDEISGTIDIGTASYSLGKVKNSDLHILYEEKDLVEQHEISCAADQLETGIKTKVPTQKSTVVANPDNCVRMYFEMEYDIFLNFGNVTDAYNYLAGAFSQVAILYANESINMTLSEVKIWDIEDPYTGDGNDKLFQFGIALNDTFNGDLAHLVGSGGPSRGWLDMLCKDVQSSNGKRVAYSGIGSTYEDVPTYSKTVNIITHEIGHNLSSPHTHSCQWNGNNTQIDDCGNVTFSGGAGECFDPINPIIPAEGGTIMSYCYLSGGGGVGINFNLGFGPQPGNLIRNSVYNATCLSPCQECTEVGNPCDDGDPCSVNDVIDAYCNCAGTYMDTDDDTVCDTYDQCPGFDDFVDYNGNGIADGCDGSSNLCACTTTINTFPHTETFEVDEGGICQDTRDDFDWYRLSGVSPTIGSGHSAAQEGSFYYFLYADSNYPYKTSGFQSACYDLSGESYATVNFWYHMLGGTMGTLTLEVSPDNGDNWFNVWSLSGNQANAWYNVTVDVSPYTGGSFSYRFIGTTTYSYTSNMALDQITLDTATGCTAGAVCNDNDACTTGDVLDINCNCAGTYQDTDNDTVCDANDICPGFDDFVDNNGTGIPDGCDSSSLSCTCTTTINTFPHTETFEVDEGEICQEIGDDFDWIRLSGTTPSTSTGPTTAQEGNFYFYIEASSPNNPYKTSGFQSACYDLSGESYAIVNFWYHMYGGTMGTLNLEVSTDLGATWVNAWSLSGDQGNAWNNVTVDVSAYSGGSFTYRFIGTTASGHHSDMALDQITVNTDIDCSTDTDNDTVCDANDQCPGFDDLLDNNGNSIPDDCDPACTLGAACDDGDPCTANDVIQANCNCAGTFRDTDNDTVCDVNDICFGFDDLVDNNGNGIPDGCDICTTIINTFPHTETFEVDEGGISQETGDDFDWIRLSGATPSNNTGPSAAHEGNFYFYIESSVLNFPEKTSGFISACYDLSEATTATVNFWYHMWGSPMGTLNMEVSPDNGVTWVNAWSLSGDQGNAWNNVTVDVSPYTGGIFLYRFIGTTAIYPTSDMALDQITLDIGGGAGCTPGTACNDNDACTTGDVYDANCNCVGAIIDSDNDGVCDANDVCPNFDDTLIGTACNDGDACTTGDVWGNDCNCAGTLQDADNDGVCDANDACPNFDDTLIGTACNDGDPNTTDDTWGTDCTCTGTPSGGCTITTLSSGGTVESSNGSQSCTTFNLGGEYEDISFALSGINSKINGKPASRYIDLVTVQYVSGGSTQTHATYTSNSTVDITAPLTAVIVCIKDNDGQTGASVRANVGAISACIGGGTPPACTPGTTCDDGNDCTSGDTYDADCNCVGTYTDMDADGVCVGDDPNDNDPCVPNVCSGCTTYNSESFEGNWGIWNNGGNDVSSDALNANTGINCVRLRDNSGQASSIYTDVLNLSTYSSLDISFSFIASSMETGEDFLLEVSTNGGSSYSVVQSWVSGTDFTNGTRYNETVTVSGLSSSTRFRIRCDASANNDRVYIDDVVIEDCSGAGKLENTIETVNIFPNPSHNHINVDLSQIIQTLNSDNIEVNIFSLNGKRVYQNDMQVSDILHLNIEALSAAQMYLLHLRTDDGRMFRGKFVKF